MCPWWIRGLSFAMLCWVPLSLPAVVAAWISAAPERGLSTKTMALMASRWAMTCLIAGLACAWSWERSMVTGPSQRCALVPKPCHRSKNSRATDVKRCGAALRKPWP